MMGTFEEYRLPFETGPHWELKREFLEAYKDNFTEDRLLCLAQAYSNIVLMQCSYPKEVMVQVLELSKPLKGCKRFAAGGTSQSKDQNESTQKQKGKRSSSDSEGSQMSKFIKFSPGSESSTKLPKSFQRFCNYQTPSTPTVDTIDYVSINKSKDTEVIDKLAKAVQKNIHVRRSAMDIIFDAAEELNLKDLLNLMVIDDIKARKKNVVTYCEFYVGTTRLAVGKGNSVINAKMRAAQLAHIALKHFDCLPTKTLEQVQNQVKKEISFKKAPVSPIDLPQTTGKKLHESQSKEDLEFLENFAFIIKQHLKTVRNVCPLGVIHNCSGRLKISDDVVFSFSEALNESVSAATYYCELIIKKITVAQGMAKKKRFAKKEAAEKGIMNLLNLLDRGKKSADQEEYLSNLITSTSHPPESSKKLPKSEKEPDAEASVSKSTVEVSESVEKDTRNRNEWWVPSAPPDQPFVVNQKMLENSISEQFILYDRTDIDPAIPNPNAILQQSSHQCRKKFEYSYESNDDGSYSADCLLDKKIIGGGFGPTKLKAKEDAAKNVLLLWRKLVYCIKIKVEREEGFLINRSDMLNLKTRALKAVSDDNIGCKMLKMMGWSGGGIGKNKGITEPISASDHSCGRGLGYTKSSKELIKNWKYMIESILNEFSRSDALTPLIFSADFLIHERSQIHMLANKYNLANRSYGKGEERQLYIRRKVPVAELLRLIIKAGGKTNKYELVDMSGST